MMFGLLRVCGSGWIRPVAVGCCIAGLLVAPGTGHAKKLFNYVYYVKYDSGAKAFEQSLLEPKSMTIIPMITLDDKVNLIRSSLNLEGGLFLNMFKPITESSTNLYATSLKTGLRTNISGEMVSGGNVRTFSTTAKNKFAFYLADKEVNGREELYRTSTKKDKAIKMNSTAVSQPVFAGFDDATLPNGKGISYRAKYNGESQFVLYLSMLKEAEPRRVSLEPANGASSLSGTWANPKSTGIMYRADADTPGVWEYYYYDIKTRGVHKPHQPLPAWSNVVSQFFDPKGKYLYYLADIEVDNKFELYRADLKTREIVTLSRPMDDDRSIGTDLSMDARGKTLYYSCNRVTSSSRELYKLDLNSMEHTRVTDEGVDIYGSAVDSLGNIYYEVQDEGSTVSQVFKKDAKTGAVAPLLSPEIPEGNHLFLQIGKTGEYAVVRTQNVESGFTKYYFQNLVTGEVIDLSSAPYGASTTSLTNSFYMQPSEGFY